MVQFLPGSLLNGISRVTWQASSSPLPRTRTEYGLLQYYDIIINPRRLTIRAEDCKMLYLNYLQPKEEYRNCITVVHNICVYLGSFIHRLIA